MHTIGNRGGCALALAAVRVGMAPPEDRARLTEEAVEEMLAGMERRRVPVTCEYCATELTAEGWCETCRIPEDWEPPYD